MAYYARDEQETTINFEFAERDRWRIYTTYPPHIRRMLEIGVITRREKDADGRTIAVDGFVMYNQVRLFKPKK